MTSPTRIATAGLQGWRAKVGDALAGPVSQRTPLAADQVRAAVGGLFFVLALTYVAKTLVVATREVRAA
jgi:hypothetical protein